MKNLKQLRESSKFTQKDLALMLHTTQQTIARWETGKAEPNLAALRDLALIFETSVDALLGNDPFQKKIQTTRYHLFASEEQDGFWGHIGLKFNGATRWFPVTASAVSNARNELREIESDEQWICFFTLSNKYIAFRPSAMEQVWLLDDACDAPEDEWNIDGPYEGLPLEMYRAFKMLNELSLSAEEWETAFAMLPKEIGSDEESAAWKTFCHSLMEKLKTDVSDRFISVVAMHFLEMKLYNPDLYNLYMDYTTLHFTNNQKIEFMASPENLKNFIYGIEDEPQCKLANFSLTNDEDCFFPLQRISAVEMPLIDFIDAIKGEK